MYKVWIRKLKTISSMEIYDKSRKKLKDTKGVTISRKLKKDKQYREQKKKDKQ
jgi:hypothetical protein